MPETVYRLSRRVQASDRVRRPLFSFLCLPPALLLFFASPELAAQVPDPSLSFFVPQSGSVTTPTEGNAAIAFFRTCPNNDGGTALPNNVRIKVVLRQSGGAPIVGVPASEICILFNGGTPEQGFAGVGADSIIANSTWNVDPLCPDVRCIPADAPTDATGTTYITLRGSTPGSPGVATRDPNRKWGHYDSNIPVFALGFLLSGRLTTASANGSYVLKIKNLDFVGGLEASADEGALVSGTDFTALAREIGGPYSYWLDFDNNGVVSATDFNILVAHMNHDCDTPLSP